MKTKNIATTFAIMAAALYAINIPISKILLTHIGPTMMAAFLYIGAGAGMAAYGFVRKIRGEKAINEPLTKKELPYTVAMVLLDIAAPIFLMIGISKTTSANVSLLNNFEIVATSLIALIVFREVITRKLWIAIGLVTLASIILSFENSGAFSFNIGSVFVLAASVCWGFENNCTRMISNKSSEEIVIIKGWCSGIGSLAIALIIGESIPAFFWVACVLLLGFISYGLSINFYIRAQKDLGAAKTSAYYSIAPFLGVAFSILLVGERPSIQFFVALAIMLVSTALIVKDTIELQHTHEHDHQHSHEHRHDDIVHEHEHTHRHIHTHIHGSDTENHDHQHNLDSHDHVHSHAVV